MNKIKTLNYPPAFISDNGWRHGSRRMVFDIDEWNCHCIEDLDVKVWSSETDPHIMHSELCKNYPPPCTGGPIPPPDIPPPEPEPIPEPEEPIKAGVSCILLALSIASGIGGGMLPYLRQLRDQVLPKSISKSYYDMSRLLLRGI